jgi:hypothetical protein
MAVLSRADILGATKTPREVVFVKELGGEVIVRGMTGAERDAFEASCFEGRGKKREFSMRNLRAKLVAFCCVDDSGKRIFSDDDVPTLGEVRADVVDRLFGVAQRLSGLREEDAEELGLSSATPTTSDTSSSASPSN